LLVTRFRELDDERVWTSAAAVALAPFTPPALPSSALTLAAFDLVWDGYHDLRPAPAILDPPICLSHAGRVYRADAERGTQQAGEPVSGFHRRATRVEQSGGVHYQLSDLRGRLSLVVARLPRLIRHLDPPFLYLAVSHSESRKLWLSPYDQKRSRDSAHFPVRTSFTQPTEHHVPAPHQER
jgi:hypothetical protein